MNISTCRELCDLSDAILALAPWEHLPESEVFALQPEKNGEVYFVSVMGACGEHCAVAYYPGRESFAKFVLAQRGELPPQDMLETMLLNGHLQAGFEARAGLQSSEIAALKKTGRSYRKIWPVFRSHRPARMPWPVNDEEAEVLRALMTLTVQVFNRMAGGEELTSPCAENKFFLLRGDGTEGVVRPSDLPLPHHRLQAQLDEHALDGMPRGPRLVELELSVMLTPIRDVPRGEPPYFPMILLAAESDSGRVSGMELLSTKEGIDAALVRLPEAIIQVIRQTREVPSRIAVRHPILHSALEAYGKLLGIEIEPRVSLPAAEQATLALHQQMGGFR